MMKTKYFQTMFVKANSYYFALRHKTRNVALKNNVIFIFIRYIITSTHSESDGRKYPPPPPLHKKTNVAHYGA